MEKIKLANHIKRGDTFHTLWTDPQGMGKMLTLNNWSKNSLPEYLWIGLIIDQQGRKEGLRTLYLIATELKGKGIAVPKISEVFALSEQQQKDFWSIVLSHVDRSILSPLTVVFTPDINAVFYNLFYEYSLGVDKAINVLLTVSRKCLCLHDELTTDICFIVVWFFVINEKIYLSIEVDVTSRALTEYPNMEHSDELMKIYRPSIRSLFGCLTTMSGVNDFPPLFWRVLGEISECNPFAIRRGRIDNMDYYELTKKTIEFIKATNDNKKMEVKFTVVMGMVLYIYRIYRDIVEKNLQNDISGHIVFRTMVESYINLKYMMIQEEEHMDIYERYKAYGVGKYKLVMAKLRERKFDGINSIQIDEKYMELLVNEEMDESFIQMSVGFFDKESIKTKFQKCGEDALYEIYYEYGTNFSHGFWGAVRESSMLICDNPAHMNHVVPDYYADQQLSSVLADCEMLMKKVFAVLSGYIELPDFYSLGN